MTPRGRAILQVAILLGVLVALVVIFPGAYRFAQMAARELRYLWWLILIAALGIWFIWGLGRKR
jgi:hypothetical protein